MQPETASQALTRTAQDTARICRRAGVPLDEALRVLKARREKLK
jgi:hypothetical protein